MKTDLPGKDSGSDQEALDRLRRDSRSASSPETRRVRTFLQDQAERVWATSVLEKAVLLGGLAVAIIGLVLVVGSLFGGSSSDGPGVLLVAEPAVTEQPAATRAPTETPAAPSQPVPTEGAIASIPPTAVPNRESCQGIQGTAYLSQLERTWYLANCQTTDSDQSELVLSPTSEPTPAPVASPTLEPPIPPLMPEEGDSFGADDAIASGASWISMQTEAGHEADRASCTASNLGYAWLVSCRIHVPGCDSAICNDWISACVTGPNGVILATKLC